MQLLQRNYAPLSGEILIDGVRIEDWNVRHLRDAQGLVSQVRSTTGVGGSLRSTTGGHPQGHCNPPAPCRSPSC